MNSKIFGTLLALFAVGRANIDQQPACPGALANRPVIAFNDLTTEKMEQFFTREKSFIIDVPAGAKLPVNLTVSGDFFALENVSQTLTFLQGCYVTYNNGQFLLSTDLCYWKKLHDFFSGKLQATFNTDRGKLEADVSCEINQQK